MKDTLEGRSVAILVNDGSDGRIVAAIRKAALKAGASVKIVAPKVGGAKASDGSMLAADGQLAGTPSVMFDAVALVLSTAGAQALFDEAAAIDFVRDAFGHLKAIALDEGGQALFDKAGCAADAGVVEGIGHGRVHCRRPRHANGIVKGRSEPSPSDAWRHSRTESHLFSIEPKSSRLCCKGSDGSKQQPDFVALVVGRTRDSL